jgi:hypothetical protein
MKNRTATDLINFDQGEFNFSAKGSEDGYRKWREELDAKKRAFETRWGVILSRRVSVSLKDHAKPLTGILESLADPKNRDVSRPMFRLKGLEFSPAQIESIVQIDAL